MVEHPDANHFQRVEWVCNYFGIAITRYQLKLLKTQHSDSHGAIAPIKTTFNEYPPGTPADKFLGRVQYKLKDSKTSNKATPPWVGYGLLEKRNDDYEPTVISLRHIRDVKTEKVVAVIENDSCAQDFRCDLIAA